MSELSDLRDRLPEVARDIKLNLQAVLQSEALSKSQLWGVAITSALAARSERLRAALTAEAARVLEPAQHRAVVDDARAASVLMAMNNVFYRFRHMVDKASYAEKPARLRMNRLGKPATDKLTFELCCLVASAINGCETCVQAHERVVVTGGISEDAVHDAIRLAATVQAAALALELPLDDSTVAAVA
ncbi:MAG TPA: carboxymuconolactone decarboxylase family protein [Polyangiaceae bacterium]